MLQRPTVAVDLTTSEMARFARLAHSAVAAVRGDNVVRADNVLITAHDAALAGLAGYFADASRQPPTLPRLREFQHAQGVVTLRWLQRRLRSAGT